MNRSIKRLLKDMIREDVGIGDLTSSFTPSRKAKAVIKANEPGYVSGIQELQTLFKLYKIHAQPKAKDGGKISAGQAILTLQGNSRDVLLVERTALNILSRMSGITTLTRKYSDALREIHSPTKVTATRKTTPLFRYFEKKAVVMGGGLTHRMGLYDMVLIKDNHLKMFGDDVEKALGFAKKAEIKSRIEVEVNTVNDALKAAEGGAHVIMLDNMKPRDVRKVVSELKARSLRNQILLEASGGISLKNIRSYGKLGVDWISIGRLTHSAAALDFSLDIVG